MKKLLTHKYSPLIWAVGMISSALYLQWKYTLTPCPLCITQRIEAFTVLFLVIVSYVIPSKLGSKLVSVLALLSAIAGAGTAIRHWWLQSHNTGDGGCGVGLNYVWDNFPLSKVISFIFKGTGDCSTIDWKLFDIFTIPQMSLIGFSGLIVLLIINLLNRIKH